MLKNLFKKSSKATNIKNHSYMDIPFSLYREQEKIGASSYSSNAIVHRCVSLIASSASHVPWKVYNKKASQIEELKNHPIARMLTHPNNQTSGADFFTSSISNLLLEGDSYILLSKENDGSINMHNIPNSYINHIYRDGSLVAYEFNNTKTKKQYKIDPKTGLSQILHIKNYNPAAQDKGLSALSAASKAINLHKKIMDWNKALLNNSSRPSGALVFQDGEGHLTDEQFERLKEQFYDNFSGSNNTGKPLILEGGLKWQDTNNAERFEKFIELKDSSARDIAVAFNVPPQLLGINGDNTYSNMQEARLALWEENIIPLLDKYSDALSYWFSGWYEEDIIIEFDRDQISALTERRENLWSKISNANFMTLNEKRQIIGLRPISGGDKIDIE